jgi:hypothetical protein
MECGIPRSGKSVMVLGSGVAIDLGMVYVTGRGTAL